MRCAVKSCAVGLVLLIATISQSANYDVVILQPSSGYPGGTVAEGGISGGQQVGNGEGPFHALLWYGTADSVVDLHPAGYVSSSAFDVSAGQQVGNGKLESPTYTSHALLWYGTAESVVDLHPSGWDWSEALGVGNGQQVGYVMNEDWQSHAVLWHGTPESMVDLHPSGYDGSVARDSSGSQQVGSGYLTADPQIYTRHALLWSGTADSVVDLHPAGFESSIACGIWDGQQVGYADDHAILWFGTADSAIDLHPSGYLDSAAYGTNGIYQVGIGHIGGLLDENCHALVWSGTADSVVDLHAYLPGWYAGSEAMDIDSSGSIIGFAYGSSIGLHAVMWVPRGENAGNQCIPAPGAMLLGTLGTVLVGCLRKRRTF